MKLLTKYDIAEIIGKRVRTIENWLNGYQTTPEDFPEPIKIGNSIRWRDSDVEEYLNSLPLLKRFSKTENYIISNESKTQQKKLFNHINGKNSSEPVAKRGRGRPRKIQAACKEAGVL
jgi:predicted DNA-binding transcriptional regulator AlpA